MNAAQQKIINRRILELEEELDGCVEERFKSLSEHAHSSSARSSAAYRFWNAKAERIELEIHSLKD